MYKVTDQGYSDGLNSVDFLGLNNLRNYQDNQDPSMKIRLSWMAIGRGKKQMLINTPSHSSNEDQVSS